MILGQQNLMWIPVLTITEHHSMLVTLVLPSPGGVTCHEHQADGPNKKETGVQGSSRIKQICSGCLLVTSYILIHPSSIYQEYLV